MHVHGRATGGAVRAIDQPHDGDISVKLPLLYLRGQNIA